MTVTPKERAEELLREINPFCNGIDDITKDIVFMRKTLSQRKSEAYVIAQKLYIYQTSLLSNNRRNIKKIEYFRAYWLEVMEQIKNI